MVTETSCVVQPDPLLFFARVTAATAPCGMVTPLPASTALVTEARYCLPAGSLPESTVSIILTATVVPAAGACAWSAGVGAIRKIERNRGPEYDETLVRHMAFAPVAIGWAVISGRGRSYALPGRTTNLLHIALGSSRRELPDTENRAGIARPGEHPEKSGVCRLAPPAQSINQRRCQGSENRNQGSQSSYLTL